jgi:hypothetical protein
MANLVPKETCSLLDIFNKCRELVIRLDIMNKPEQVYSADGKGCSLHLDEEAKVIDQKEDRSVHTVAYKHGGVYINSFMQKYTGGCCIIRHMP